MGNSKPKQPNQVDVLVGERIREARKELGLTQQGLAEQLGMSFQQIQKYETGKNRIAAGMLYEVAAVLKKSVIWFFEDASSRLSAGQDEKTTIYMECLGDLHSLQNSSDLTLVRDFIKMAVRNHQTSTLL